MAVNHIIKTGRYPWTLSGKIHVCGFIWNGEESVDSQRFIAMTENHSASFDEFREWCRNLNGEYSVIVEKPGEVWLATSHIWSYPLFYTHDSRGTLISDDPGQCLADHLGELSNREIVLHFLHFCATPGGTTLVKSISQLRPGEVLRLGSSGIDSAGTGGAGESKTRKPATPEELKTLLYHVFERFIRLFGNKQILLPLTSGYDSRLIACLLKEFGMKEVICATWGRESMPERITAEKVARKLGYRYIFIPYDEKLTGSFEKEPGTFHFLHYCGHFSSMPYLQDYFAIRQMLAEGILSSGDIALPGLSGDFIRGSHLYDELLSQNDPEIALEIMRMFGTSYVRGKEEKEMLLQTMLRYHFDELGNLPGRLKFDLWDYTERQCKFIGNSSRVYPYFGIQNFTLLLDRELVRFFLSLPADQRIGAQLYNETLEKLIFKSAGVDFDLKKKVPTSRKFSSVKEKIIEGAPAFLRRLYYPLDDDVYYREITGKLMKNDGGAYRQPVKTHFYNCTMAQWYLRHVNRNLQNISA